MKRKRKNHCSSGQSRDRRKQLEQGARRINRVARQRMGDESIIWYVLFVPSQKEYVTQKMITQWVDKNTLKPTGTDAGYVYLPLYSKWRRVNRFSRNKRRFAFPAMPGCLWFGVKKGNEAWFELFRLHLVHGVMSVANRPAGISGERLNRFIIENNREFGVPDAQQFMRSHHEFKTGDKVKIVEGPLDGHLVDVQAIEGVKARILLELLGGSHEVEIALGKLEKAA
ncbi:MAG: hypothetical protein GY742_03460 [Hyphomicrobiales bacterium]|nr:hypothetical protein [Hyphomicrobiales bacterium]